MMNKKIGVVAVIGVLVVGLIGFVASSPPETLLGGVMSTLRSIFSTARRAARTPATEVLVMRGYISVNAQGEADNTFPEPPSPSQEGAVPDERTLRAWQSTRANPFPAMRWQKIEGTSWASPAGGAYARRIVRSSDFDKEILLPPGQIVEYPLGRLERYDAFYSMLFRAESREHEAQGGNTVISMTIQAIRPASQARSFMRKAFAQAGNPPSSRGGGFLPEFLRNPDTETEPNAAAALDAAIEDFIRVMEEKCKLPNRVGRPCPVSNEWMMVRFRHSVTPPSITPVSPRPLPTGTTPPIGDPPPDPPGTTEPRRNLEDMFEWLPLRETVKRLLPGVRVPPAPVYVANYPVGPVLLSWWPGKPSRPVQEPGETYRAFEERVEQWSMAGLGVYLEAVLRF